MLGLDLYRLICIGLLNFLLIWRQYLCPWIGLVFFIGTGSLSRTNPIIIRWKDRSTLERTRRSGIKCAATYSIVAVREKLGLLLNISISELRYLIHISLLLPQLFIFDHGLDPMRKLKYLLREIPRLLFNRLLTLLALTNAFPKLLPKSRKWISVSWVFLRGTAGWRWWLCLNYLVPSYYPLLSSEASFDLTIWWQSFRLNRNWEDRAHTRH